MKNLFLNFIKYFIIFIILTTSVMAKQNIVILATGGTIAGTGVSSQSAGYKAATLGVDQLLQAVPEVQDIANVRGEQVAQVASQDMNNATWLKLAKRVQELSNSSKVDGIVITHGTDTLEETAYFLNLVIHTNKPIVLVGAMRPSTAISADGPMNLFQAVLVATSPESKNKGVLVVMNDTIFSARDVMKTNTFLVNAFNAPNSGPLGYVAGNKVEYLSDSTKINTMESEFNIANITELPMVDIFYGYAEANPSYLDYAQTLGIKGIVYAGVGNGNLYSSVLTSLQNATKKSIVVVRSSRIFAGVVVRNDEIDDDANNFVASGGVNPQKSRILLMLGLTKSSDPKYIQGLFDRY